MCQFRERNNAAEMKERNLRKLCRIHKAGSSVGIKMSHLVHVSREFDELTFVDLWL